MENDAVELEAMRKEDSSWHPCQISLNRSPSGVSLIVECDGNDSNHIILHKEEALKCLRVRSLHLQGDDCSNIKQGDHILATQDSQAKNLFFDAVVEKVLSVRHSKRIHCRCTFMVKWLHRDFKEAFIVPSSSIMKLSTKSMNVHPTVSKFLNTVKSWTFSGISLEKQIDGISDPVRDSKKKSKEHLVSGVEVDTKGQVPQNHNPLKRSTRSKNKMPTEIKVRDPPPSPPSIQEEPPRKIKVRDPPPSPPSIKEDFLENRSPLNPLAARAALASLISRLPRNLEICHEEQKCFTYPSHVKAQKQVKTEFVVNHSSMTDKLCSKIENGSGPFGPKNESIVKPLFCASIKKVDTEEMKLSCETKRRLTRSTAHKEEEIQECDSYDRNEDTEEKRKTVKRVERNKKNSSDTRRSTRSAGRLETGNNVTSEIQGLGENKVYEHVKSEEKKPIFTPLNEESNLPSTEETNKKRKMANAGNVERGEVVNRKSTSSTKPALRSSPRFSQNKS